jgi:TPR repeat protein
MTTALKHIGHIFICCAITYLVSLSQGVAQAESFSICDMFFVSDDQRKKIDDKFLSMAGANDYAEGLAYQIGINGKSRNLNKARTKFAQSAKLGNPDGMYAYGNILLRFATSESDRASAYRWSEKAANAGHSGGIAAMAQAYKRGVPGFKKISSAMCSFLSRRHHSG